MFTQICVLAHTVKCEQAHNWKENTHVIRSFLIHHALMFQVGQAADSETDVLLVYVAYKLMFILFIICVS